MKHLPAILFFLAFSVFSAETFDFRRTLNPGEWMTARIHMESGMEFRLVIPGAADPVRRLRSARIFLLGSLRIDRCGTNGEPLQLTIRPLSAGGAINGETIPPDVLSGKEILADLSGRKPIFRSSDGKKLPKKAELLLNVLFQKTPFMEIPSLFGKSMKLGKKGDRKPASTTAVLRQLKARNIALKDQKLKSGVVYDGAVKTGNIACHQFRLEIETDRPEDYDVRLRIKLNLPADPRERNMIGMERSGIEVVSGTLNTPDPMASDAQYRLITSENLSMLCVPLAEKKKAEKTSGNLLDRLFR